MSSADTYLFGIFLTVSCYYVLAWFRGRFRLRWLNPLFFAILVIIALLQGTGISYEQYMKGGGVIHALLGPVTVVLALPLYRQRHLLSRHKYAICGGVLTGVVVALVSVLLLGRILGLSPLLERSLLAHSITTPIGISVSRMLAATEGITIVAIILTGIIGAALAPLVMKVLRIHHPVARGIGIGVSSHALGTSKALEMGEVEAAMSSLAMGLAALLTVLLVLALQMLGLY